MVLEPWYWVLGTGFYDEKVEKHWEVEILENYQKMFEHWRKEELEEQRHWRRLKILEFEGNEAYGCG